MVKRALLQQLVMPRSSYVTIEVEDIEFSFAGCEHVANAYDLSSDKGVPLDIQYKTMYLIH